MAETRLIPTVTLERSILHYLLRDRAVLQGEIRSCREEWFTGRTRPCIFSIILKAFDTSRVPMSDTQFDFRLNAQFPTDENEGVRKEIADEYAIIKSMDVTDGAEVVIQSLDKALLAEKTREAVFDIYGMLQKGDVEQALQTLKESSIELKQADRSRNDAVTSLWDDTQEWEDEIKNRKDFPEQYAGLKTGFKKYDDLTGGLFPAELNVIFGLSGKGKSTLMKQIGVNVRKNGFNVLHCANEENRFQILSKYRSVETGVRYQAWKKGQYTEADLASYENYRDEQRQNKSGKLFVHTFDQQTDATEIERKLVELKSMGIKIDLLIVDYLDLMSSIKRAYNENDEGGRVTGDLKQLAIDFNIPVLVCTQAATTAEKQESRERPFLNASDVFGTKRKVHSANTLIGIVNQTATVGAGERDESELKRHRLVICVPKNRDGPVFTFRLIIEVETGRVVEDDEDDEEGMKQETAAKALLDEAAKEETRQTTDLKTEYTSVSQKKQAIATLKEEAKRTEAILRDMERDKAGNECVPLGEDEFICDDAIDDALSHDGAIQKDDMKPDPQFSLSGFLQRIRDRDK